jgi:4a-hydroxytetrahydrobiopterin dehydratase
MTALASLSCRPLPAGTAPLDPQRMAELLAEVPGWTFADGAIGKTWSFGSFHETMAFANAVAWIAHRQDHHPDVMLAYGRCSVKYSTHSVGGVSENDFICAARIEALFR